MLVHDNETYPDIKWTSRINDFVREDFVLEDEYATNHITIEDALSHRTGLPRHDHMYGQQDDTLRSVVQRIRYLPVTREPRTKWQYCNLMFAVVTDLIETVTGISLEHFLEKKIWKPLGMASTTWTKPDSARLARAYYWDPDQEQYVTDPYVDLSPISGAGATISTVNDYALWIKAWLEAPFHRNDSSPLTPRMYNDLWGPRAILPPEMTSNSITPPLYGLGWITIDFEGQPLVSHGGSLTGFGTELFILPESGFGIVTMGNTLGTSNAVGAAIAGQLLVEKLGQKGAAHEKSLLSALDRLPKPHLQSSARWMRDRPSQFRAPVTNDGTTLADSITNLAGLYSHPAYGQINLTVTESADDSGEGLQFLLYPRMWPMKARLVHKTGSVFKVLLLDAHGTGDIPSGKGIVWEEIGESEAVFEYAPYDGVVRSMGVVFDEEMVMAAMEKGPDHWKEAMVWFERR